MVRRLLTGALFALTVAAGTAPSLAQEPNRELRITQEQAEAILGLDALEGVTLGPIFSGPKGVRLSSFTIDYPGGRTVRASQVMVSIALESRLDYQISRLTIEQFEIVDLANRFRAAANDIAVTNPGPNFLSGIQSLMTAIPDGARINTSALSFSELSIPLITVSVYDAEANQTQGGRIEDVSITGATPNRFGTVQIGRVQDDEETGDILNAQIVNVDRAWMDRALTTLLTNRDWEEAERRPLIVDDTGVYIPFDRIAVERASAKVEDADNRLAVLTNLSLDILRDTASRYGGLEGQFNLDVPVSEDDAGGLVSRVLRGAGGAGKGDVLSLAVGLSSRYDPATRMDSISPLSIISPGLGALNGEMMLQGLSPLLTTLFSGASIEDQSFGFGTSRLTYTDNGLFRYLLSEDNPDADDVRAMFALVPLLVPNLSNADDLEAGLEAFFADPGTIELRVVTPQTVPLDAIREMADDVTVTLTFKGRD